VFSQAFLAILLLLKKLMLLSSLLESTDSNEAYAIESSQASRTRPQAEVVLTTGVGGPERRALYPQQPVIGGLLFVAFGVCLAFPRSLCSSL